MISKVIEERKMKGKIVFYGLSLGGFIAT